MPRQLLVESIRIDGETQSRERINEETVAEFAEAMKGPAAGSVQAWPAVTVFFDGTDYWLADGFHRLLAARREMAEGQRPIRAILKQSFDGPALEAAISMLAGVVACPSLMFGTLPDDDIIEAAVDIVLKGAGVAAPAD